MASTTAPEVRTVEDRRGETRRLIHMLSKRAAFGALVTLATQNVVTAPAWLAFAAPVLSVLRIRVAGA